MILGLSSAAWSQDDASLAKAPSLLFTADEILLETEPAEGPETRALLRRLLASETDSGDPGLSSLSLGLGRLREMEEEPVVFPQISRMVFAPANFVVEGLSYLMMPDSIRIGGQKVFDRGFVREDLGTIYARTLVKKEASFLAGLSDSDASSINVELGTEEMDLSRVRRRQNRVLIDSFKRAYKERYQLPPVDLDTLRESFTSGNWLDFVVIPTAFSVIVARQGIERKIRLSDDVRIDLTIEKGTRIYEAMRDHEGGRLAGLSINFFDLPFSPIMTVDSLEDGIGVGFAGIGTDLDAVTESINGLMK